MIYNLLTYQVVRSTRDHDTERKDTLPNRCCTHSLPNREEGLLSNGRTSTTDIHILARDGGAYLLRHKKYLVDAAADCSLGYANEGWGDANSFFQHSAGKKPVIMMVIKRIFPAWGIYEITVNYWKEYWKDRFSRLDEEGRRQYHQCYGNG